MLSRLPARGKAAAGTLRGAGFAGTILAAGLLASCSTESPGTKVKFTEAEYGVAASPRLVASGKPVPKGGGRYMVGKPYRVAGKTYVPRDQPGYSAVGLASWYGPNFHGRKTANGEIYDMRELTAAHPTLPLPSYARVTNLTNGHSVVVRINDRGPFLHNRIIDVSSTAAEVLDFKRTGVAKVKVDYVGPARMDGKDRQMLIASYRAPGTAPAPSIIAEREPQARTVLASLTRPLTTRQPTTRHTIDFSVADDKVAPVPAVAYEDPLGPLILQTGFTSTSSYLPVDRFSHAHAAAAGLAAAGSDAARAAAAIGGDTTSGPVVQVGTFSDAGNARKVADRFARFGETTVSGEGGFTIVRVAIAGHSPGAVIEAAAAAGLRGAFLISK